MVATPSDLGMPVHEEQEINTPTEMDFPIYAPDDHSQQDTAYAPDAPSFSADPQSGIPCYNYAPNVVIRLVNHLPAHCLITASVSDGWVADIQHFPVSLNRDAFFLQILAQGIGLSVDEVRARYRVLVNGYRHQWPEMLTGSSVDGCKIVLARNL